MPAQLPYECAPSRGRQAARQPCSSDAGFGTRDSLGAAVGSRLLLGLLDFMLVELIVALPPRCECVVVVAAAVAVADGT